MSCLKATKLLFALALLTTLLSSACSRPRLAVEPQAKASADATLRLGQNLEQRQNFTDAQQTYASALNQYKTFADTGGQMYALAGLARIAHHDGDSEGFADYLQQMQHLVAKTDPEVRYILDLLDIHILHQQGRYQEILALAQDDYNYPLGIRMQILTHRLQAESYLNPGQDTPTGQNLERLTGRYKARLRTDFVADPIVLASAYYALAYSYFLQDKTSSALKNIDAAIHWDYLYENFPGLGYAYWLKGQILDKQGENSLALSALLKAKDIFGSYANAPMVEKTRLLILTLEEKP